MKQIVVVVASLVAGFIGGIVGSRSMPPREQATPSNLIRARGFELVDEAGQAVSFWGLNSHNTAELVFGSHWSQPPAKGRPDRPLALRDEDNQRLAIGVSGDFPFLDFRATDGSARMNLSLDEQQKPSLLMSDDYAVRVVLGIRHSDAHDPTDNSWALAFVPDVATLGMATLTENGQTYVAGEFWVNKNKQKYPYRQTQKPK